MISFGDEERRIRSLLSVGATFILGDGSLYEVVFCGKPTCSRGEPKTDIFVVIKNSANKHFEVKISFKKENADFLENKTNEERASQLFGDDWSNIISDATFSIHENFMNRPLIYKENYRRTEAGSITLGWKFELLNKPGGDLSGRLNLTREQVIDVYAGTNLSDDKRNAVVNGRVIQNSGVANFILMDDRVETTQDVIDSLIPIEEYVDEFPDIFFACKALNYRTFAHKWDGDRPLSVFIHWKVNKGVLVPEYIFSNPLVVKGNQVANNLIRCLQSLGVNDTDDINYNNVSDGAYVYGM